MLKKCSSYRNETLHEMSQIAKTLGLTFIRHQYDTSDRNLIDVDLGGLCYLGVNTSSEFTQTNKCVALMLYWINFKIGIWPDLSSQGSHLTKRT